jgi:type I restriction enzyme S subunit
MSDLPTGWSWATIEDVAAAIDYGTSAKTQEDPAGVPVLRMGNISGGQLQLEDLRYLPANHDEFPKLLLNAGDVLFNRTNSPELVGKTAVYTGQPSPCSFASYLLRIKLVGYEPELLSSYINSSHGRIWVASVASQQVGQANVNSTKLKALRIPVPPITEQRRIVSKLESLRTRSRRAKEALDAIPALLEKFRQSVLAAAFRGDLTADWRAQHPDIEPASKLLERIRAERRRRWEEAELEKMRAKGKAPQHDSWKARYTEPESVDTSDLPDLPPGWCWVSLGTLLQQIEAGHSPKALGRPADSHEAGVLKVSAVSWGEFLPEENKALPQGYPLDSSITVNAGDLLISRANTAELVGAVVLVQEAHPNLMLSDKTLRLVPFASEISKEYLLFSLRTRWVRDIFEEDATGTSDSMRNLSQEKIRSAPIALAPIAEQQEIARQLNLAMERCTRLLEQQRGAVNKSEHLEQALLAKAFRGELVPQDPNDEPASVLLERIRAEREATAGSAPKRSRGRSSAA